MMKPLQIKGYQHKSFISLLKMIQIHLEATNILLTVLLNLIGLKSPISYLALKLWAKIRSCLFS